MKVAWHEVPGIRMKAARPVGNGVKQGKVFVHTPTLTQGSPTDHTVPYGTES